MVGATITSFEAAASTRCLKYSAIRKSLFSGGLRACSLHSAPSGMTTTLSGVRARSASSQVRFSRRTAACFLDSCRVAELLVDCAQLKAAMPSETQDKMPEYRVRLFIFSPCLSRLPRGHPLRRIYPSTIGESQKSSSHHLTRASQAPP